MHLQQLHDIDCDNRPNIALVGDFNATSPKWCASDKYNCAGRLIEESVLRLGLHQLVDFPTHLTLMEI